MQKRDIRIGYIWIPSKGVYSIVYILKLLYKIWDPILDEKSIEDPVYPPQNQALEEGLFMKEPIILLYYLIPRI